MQQHNCSFIQIVKEYERAVILRLGRLTDRKAKGPGLFFVLPCIDKVEVVDLRTVTLDVPPQEVSGCLQGNSYNYTKYFCLKVFLLRIFSFLFDHSNYFIV